MCNFLTYLTVLLIYAKWLAVAGSKALTCIIINENSSLLGYIALSAGK